MKCKDIRIVINGKRAMSPLTTVKVTTHIKTCLACQDRLFLDRLAPAIIKAAGASDFEIPYATSNPILINKIRNRIQETRDLHCSSWELAIESMRGWLAAFAATAIILIAFSIQWQPSAITNDLDHDNDELITQYPAEYLIIDIPDLGSIGKDNPHAHK